MSWLVFVAPGGVASASARCNRCCNRCKLNLDVNACSIFSRMVWRERLVGWMMVRGE